MRVAASPFRLSINYHFSRRCRSASMIASSRLRSSSISEKCLRRLLSSSLTRLSSFWDSARALVRVNISLSQVLMRSTSCASLVLFSVLLLFSSFRFSSLSFCSLPFSVLISALSLSSRVRWSLTSPSCSCLFSLLIFSISFSLQLRTYLIWLFSLSISSFFSSVCLARSCRSRSSSPQQLALVFSRESILVSSSLIICAWESSSSAAVASIFCMMILQLERDSQMLAPSTLGVELDLRLFSTSRSCGFFYRARMSERKLYSISFLMRRYSCFFSSSTISPSRSCCSTAACVLNSSSILASLTSRSSTGGDSSWMSARLSLSFWGLLISLNLTTKSLSRFRKIAMRSMRRSKILRVRCASTMVGLPSVCFRLFIISLRFFAYCTFLLCPGLLIVQLRTVFYYNPPRAPPATTDYLGKTRSNQKSGLDGWGGTGTSLPQSSLLIPFRLKWVILFKCLSQ